MTAAPRCSATLLALAITAAAATMTAGCHSTPGAAPEVDAGDADGVFATCATDDRAMPYQPGMRVMSRAGAFSVALVQSVPGPPVKGNNAWTVEVDDATTAAALDGLVVAASGFMPDHG